MVYLWWQNVTQKVILDGFITKKLIWKETNQCFRENFQIFNVLSTFLSTLSPFPELLNFFLSWNFCHPCNFLVKNEKKGQKLRKGRLGIDAIKRNCRLGISKFLITKSGIFRSRDQFFSIFFLQNFLKMSKLYHT